MQNLAFEEDAVILMADIFCIYDNSNILTCETFSNEEIKL